MNDNQKEDQQFRQKTELLLQGYIDRVQPYKDNLISFYIDQEDSIYIYNPENQQIVRTIKVKEKLKYVRSYIIQEDLNYIIFTEVNKWSWKSNCYKLNEDKMYPQAEFQIIGIRDQVIIVYYQLVVKPFFYLLSLKTIDLQGEILYERKLITTRNLSHYCFDTSYIIIQYEIQRIWAFLKNNRRIQIDFIKELDQPNQNMSHNKNYYLFGYYLKRCANFMVRKIFFKHENAKAKQIGKWLYIRDFDCQTKNSPLTRVDLTNCSVQELFENQNINCMTRTNNSKYLIYTIDNKLSTIEIIQKQ